MTSIFGNFVIFQKFNGLDPQGGHRNTIARVVYSVLFISFNSLTSIYIALNFRRNPDQALYAVSIVVANSAYIPTYFHLLINREQFYSLLSDMHDIVHESLSQ